MTKALTGMMLADAIERGELSMDSTAAELLPALARTKAGTVTVRELCTHTSGLPRLPWTRARRPASPCSLLSVLIPIGASRRPG